jgi:hypothetical protein
MANTKQEPEDFYSDDYKDKDNQRQEQDFTEEEENKGLDPYSPQSGSGESVVDKPTIDNFFNTEQLLQEIEKTMKGFQKQNNEWVYKTTPKARDEFINSMINRLRSVINQQNMVSNITEEEAKFLLLEKNTDFIFSIHEEPSVDDEDLESIVNIFDHALQIFMGHVISGFSSRTLRQISASVSYEMPEKKNNDGLFGVSFGDANVLKVGGNK